LITGFVSFVLFSLRAVDFWAMKQLANMVRKTRKEYKKNGRNWLIENPDKTQTYPLESPVGKE